MPVQNLGGGGGGWDKQSVFQAMRKRKMAGLISTYSCNLFISVATPSTCMFRLLIFSAFAGKQSGTSIADPSGVVQGIPATVDEDSIANLADEEDHITGAMATSHSSAPINHDEEMFKGN